MISSGEGNPGASFQGDKKGLNKKMEQHKCFRNAFAPTFTCSVGLAPNGP